MYDDDEEEITGVFNIPDMTDEAHEDFSRAVLWAALIFATFGIAYLVVTMGRGVL